MKRDEMKAALQASLEGQAVAEKDRFERAELAAAILRRSPKTVIRRDTYSMPADEYEQVARLHAAAVRHTGDHRVTRSQVARAALALLADLEAERPDEFAARVARVARIKPGPK